MRDAAEALHRQRFAERVSEELAELRSNPDAWADYLDEDAETSVADGIGR